MTIRKSYAVLSIGIMQSVIWVGESVSNYHNESTERNAIGCTYDHDKLLLTRGDLNVTLTSNEGYLLLALINGTTEKEELIECVWGMRGLIVSDSSYYKALHTLRHYLSQVGLERTALKTLPRRGAILLVPIELIPTTDGVAACAVDDASNLQGEIESLPLPPGVNTTPEFKSDQPNQSIFQKKSNPLQPIEARNNSNSWNMSGLVVACLIALGSPLYYSYLMISKPLLLEPWREIGRKGESINYVEESENITNDKILEYMAGFNISQKSFRANYFVRKPFSQLLVSCVKPESRGEGLCVNFITIEQQD